MSCVPSSIPIPRGHVPEVHVILVFDAGHSIYSDSYMHLLDTIAYGSEVLNSGPETIRSATYTGASHWTSKNLWDALGAPPRRGVLGAIPTRLATGEDP